MQGNSTIFSKHTPHPSRTESRLTTVFKNMYDFVLTSRPLPPNGIRAQSSIFLQIDGVVAIFNIQGDLVLQGLSHLRLEAGTPYLILQSYSPASKFVHTVATPQVLRRLILMFCVILCILLKRQPL